MCKSMCQTFSQGNNHAVCKSDFERVSFMRVSRSCTKLSQEGKIHACVHILLSFRHVSTFTATCLPKRVKFMHVSTSFTTCNQHNHGAQVTSLFHIFIQGCQACWTSFHTSKVQDSSVFCSNQHHAQLTTRWSACQRRHPARHKCRCLVNGAEHSLPHQAAAAVYIVLTQITIALQS